MLAAARENGELAKQGKPSKTSQDATLSDIGISKNQSSRWQKMAKMPRQPPTSENMSDIDFNGVTLGVTKVRHD